jgi:hypothetical protein
MRARTPSGSQVDLSSTMRLGPVATAPGSVSRPLTRTYFVLPLDPCAEALGYCHTGCCGRRPFSPFGQDSVGKSGG